MESQENRQQERIVGQDVELLLDRVREVLEPYEPVRAAYLFGSYARGGAAPDSDLDLGLVGPREGLEERRLDILADLVAAGVERVDLVFLDDADTVMRFEAVSPNRLVYSQPTFDHGSYFSRTVREYFDFEPYLRIQREAVKRRILEGRG